MPRISTYYKVKLFLYDLKILTFLKTLDPDSESGSGRPLNTGSETLVEPDLFLAGKAFEWNLANSGLRSKKKPCYYSQQVYFGFTALRQN